jgi:hypothetical protein
VAVNEPGQILKERSLDAYIRKDRAAIVFSDRLYSLCIVDVSTNERYLVFTAHHCCCDSWVLDRVFKQVCFAYLYRYSSWVLLSAAPFYKYMKDSHTVVAMNFWSSVLKGAVAKPLFVVPEDYGHFHPSYREKTIHLPKFPRSDITLATMIQLAWALVVS